MRSSIQSCSHKPAKMFSTREHKQLSYWQRMFDHPQAKMAVAVLVLAPLACIAVSYAIPLN